MHNIVSEICDELDSLALQMMGINNTTQSYAEHAWHLPALTPKQLADYPRKLSEQLRAADVDDLSNDIEEELKEVSATLKSLKVYMVPNLHSNPNPGVQGYVETMGFVNATLAPLLGWLPVKPSYLPSSLIRKMNRIEGDLNGMIPNKEMLRADIASIIEAKDAADALPTTMEELKTTQAEIRKISGTASELVGKISDDRTRATSAMDAIFDHAVEAESLAAQAAEAYRITTTVGLAAAFDDRATKLNSSLTKWVFCLVGALAVLMVVGYFRLSAMKEALSIASTDGSKVWIQLLLSILSVGAPIWLAWIATKQISQRFRLAEDYAFKASVAKAYEGYRREAVRIDPLFEKALFASALSRLDEAPLRLMETATHGSPLHEFANSSLAKSILGRFGTSKSDAALSDDVEPVRSSAT